MSIFEKLANKYFEYTGQSPEQSFLNWLDSIGMPATDKALKELLNDKEMWKEMKNDRD